MRTRLSFAMICVIGLLIIALGMLSLVQAQGPSIEINPISEIDCYAVTNEGAYAGTYGHLFYDESDTLVHTFDDTIPVSGTTVYTVADMNITPGYIGRLSIYSDVPFTGTLVACGSPVSIYPFSPASNSHTVPSNVTISITYPFTINLATVSTQTFAVHAMQTGWLTQTFSVSGGTVSLTPPQPFKPGELVQVSATTGTVGFSGTIDFGEKPDNPTVWQFRTVVEEGNGVFTDSGQSLGNVNTRRLTLGDVDGDGDLDAFVPNTNLQPDKIWLNDGTGIFTDSGQALGNLDSENVTLGDIDGDGDLDAVITTRNNNQPNKIWLNDGLGTFSDSGQTLGDRQSGNTALGDVDGDGDLDAVIANYNENSKLWLNDGSGTFSDSGQNLGTGLSVSVALGDADGDGDLDAFVTDNNGINHLWLNDGSGNFADSGQSLGASLSDTGGLALGDVDNDGDLDVFYGNYNSQANEIWLNDGTGVFTDSGQSLGSASTAGVALGDLDADGDLDAYVANNGLNRIWLNNGSGIFTDSNQSLGISNSVHVALGDLDNDGDLDAIVGNYGANKVWLNQNKAVSSYFNHFTNLDGWILNQGLVSDRCDLPILQTNSIVYSPSGNRAGYVELPNPVVQSATNPLTVTIRYRFNASGGLYLGLTKNNDFICEHYHPNDGFVFALGGEGGDKIHFTATSFTEILVSTTHDSNWHIAKLIRNGSGYWSMYIDDVLLGTSPYQDQFTHYQYLTVQAYGSGIAEFDYISVTEGSGDAQTSYSISGLVTDDSANPITDVIISASGGYSATTDTNGVYRLTGMITSTYTLTPSKIGYSFSPPQRTVSIPLDATEQNFVALPTIATPYLFIEEFDSANPFVTTHPSLVYIDEANSRAVLNVERTETRLLWRSIPELTSGDFRLTVNGQFNTANNNCWIHTRLSDGIPAVGQLNPGAEVHFAFFGGGCSNNFDNIRAYWTYPNGQSGTTFTGYQCGGSNGTIIPINRSVPYIAELEISSSQGTAILSVFDASNNLVGSLTADAGFESDFGTLNTLSLGMVAGNDWPSCGGYINSVRIEAIGNTLPTIVYLPLILKQEPVVSDPVLNGDFENGPVAWTEYSSYGHNLIRQPWQFPGSVSPHSGSWAVWLGGDYDYVSYIRQTLTVPSNAPYLTYWHWIASADICGYDYGGVGINGNWHEYYDLCSDTNTNGWVLHTTDLSAYAGQSINLDIVATTDSSLNSNLFIDDVSFQASRLATPKPPATHLPASATGYIVMPSLIEKIAPQEITSESLPINER